MRFENQTLESGQECVEVEVIQDTHEQLPVNIELVSQKQHVQQVVVQNGEQKINNIEFDVFFLVCPKCGQVIKQFQPGVTEAEIRLSMNALNDKELNSFIYCQTCGQKLRIMRPAPVDVQCEVVKTEDEQ